ncbi:MAG: FtsX-like permease family protein [Luteitalea sp.]|nr:FtsX-like permease family protein [Luteitalea sp.]
MAVCLDTVREFFAETGRQEPERIHVASVGPGFFRVLGAPALLGRTLEPADFEAGQRAVVISHSFWRQRFGGTTDAIGKSIDHDGARYEVVGVMAAEFELPTADVQVWTPMSAQPELWRRLQDPRSRAGDMVAVLGRLSPTATFESAQAELDTIAARLRDEYPDTNAESGVLIEPLTGHVLGSRTAPALWFLFGAVGFVLLIACANVANLALARGAARRHELSIRTALGASKRRLARQALTESLVLAVLAASVGLLFAWLVATALTTWAASALPRLETVRLDLSVFLFALVVSLASGLIAGLLPALQSSTVNPVDALREGGARLAGGRGSRLRHGLVIAELALAVVLLSGAGLLIRSFVRVQTVDRGFDSRHLLLLQVALPDKYDDDQDDDLAQRAAYFREAFERIRGIPGVAAAGAVTDFFIQRNADQLITIEGQPRNDVNDLAPPLTRDWVIPGYFEALRVPLLQGRLLRDSDLDPRAPPVAVINEAMARAFWPGQNPVGTRLKWGANPDADTLWTTVVGVVADMTRQSLDEAVIPYMFAPGVSDLMDVVVRTVGDPDALRDAIRAELRSLEPTAPPYGVVAVEQQLRETVALRTLQTLLLGTLALVALILAVIGVYGVIHQSVVARTQEIGVRMALGASKRSVLGMVLSAAIGLAATGLGLGMIGALALAQTLSSFLYETSPLDPLIYIAVAALLVVVTTVACLAPAYRAARVDPMAALRYE